MEVLKRGLVSDKRVCELFKHSIDGTGNCRRIWGTRRIGRQEMKFRSMLVKCECGGQLEICQYSEARRIFRCVKCRAEYVFTPITWHVKRVSRLS